MLEGFIFVIAPLLIILTYSEIPNSKNEDINYMNYNYEKIEKKGNK